MDPTPTSFGDELRAALERSLAEQLEHPFVRGLADGTLPPERFRRFIRQDYLFLLEYVRALELAAEHAPSPELGERLAALARETASDELAQHRALAADWGISAEELDREPIAPPTRAYAGFLLRTASLGEFGEIAAALLPCTWGYSELGRRLAAAPRSPEERYGRWIDLYAGDDFARLADWCRRVTEAEAATAGTSGRERMREAFLTSCRYELAFWELAWREEAP